ncbi:MAG: ATP-dependent zinc metalloprotease FtsH, partial [Rickettsiales bacterium]|nr:ATP-dependent zinc metalloprotease FtsH [Rickettsiales bacterium]
SDFFGPFESSSKKLILSEFLTEVQNNGLKSVELRSGSISGELKSGEKFNTFVSSYIVDYYNLIKDLRANGVEIKIAPNSVKKSIIMEIALYWLPLFAMMFFFARFRGVGSGDANPFNFSRSKARISQTKGKITFEDVAGIDEAKEEVKELVDFLKDPEKYTDIGAKIPRGCLLIGPPGTGKTLLAKAIAGEADVPFYFISGSDFVEMFVGVGASRVRNMFSDAKKNAPCLVFIDEIDAVGRHRGVGIGGGNDEREQTLNQLLVEMDGFESNDGVIIIAATNREDVLDKALLRPGRFDRQVTIQLPDIKGREEILKVHAKKVKMAPSIDLKSIAKSTSGFNGAELANIINEAGLLAARINKKVITDDEIEEAKERVVMGVKNKSRVKKEEETKLIAYHEAGHTIVAINCKNSDPLYKVTIISRGRVGGYVSMPSEDDGRLTATTKASMIDSITTLMGGRVAEEIIFGDDKITAGAIGDIKNATHIAKDMISRFGMNDKIGPIYCGNKLNYEDSYEREASSNEMLNTIDSEVKNLILKCKGTAEKIISSNRNSLIILAEALLKYETLTGDEVRDIVNGKEIRKFEAESDTIDDSVSLLVKIMEENDSNCDKKS